MLINCDGKGDWNYSAPFPVSYRSKSFGCNITGMPIGWIPPSSPLPFNQTKVKATLNNARLVSNLYDGNMTEQLPQYTEEQWAFNKRLTCKMIPLVKKGMDLRDAEREAAQLVADNMRAEGDNSDLVNDLLNWALGRANKGDRPTIEGNPVSTELHDLLTESYAEENELPPTLLLEKLVKTSTGFKMFIFPNESKHPGYPHISVLLGDETVNISICKNPKVIAGNAKVRGIGAALKSIETHHMALKKEWDALRPDDQKLKNSKRRMATGKKVGRKRK